MSPAPHTNTLARISVVNVIATSSIAGLIDVETLSSRLPNARYKPKVFVGLVYPRRSKPRVTMIMFHTGRISSHGAKSEDDAKQAIIATLKEIVDLDCVVGSSRIKYIKIENVVGSGSLGQGLDLEILMNNLSHTIYEPGQFSGLMYRPFNNQVVCLIFSTGKVVIVGAKSKSQILETFQCIKNTILHTLKNNASISLY